MQQNVQCYKSPNVTKRPMLQNSQCYKTPNVTKRPITKCPTLQQVCAEKTVKFQFVRTNSVEIDKIDILTILLQYL